MAFEKGNVANPGGRPKVKAWRDALERAVKQIDKKAKRPRLELIAEACVVSAMNGDAQAYKEIGDRLDGKVAQAIIGGDEDEPSIKISRVEIVAAGSNHSTDRTPA